MVKFTNDVQINYAPMVEKTIKSMETVALIKLINKLFSQKLPLDSTATITSGFLPLLNAERGPLCTENITVKIDNTCFTIGITEYYENILELSFWYRRFFEGTMPEFALPDPYKLYLVCKKDMQKKEIIKSSKDSTDGLAVKCDIFCDYTIESIIEEDLIPFLPFYMAKYDEILSAAEHSECEEEQFVTDLHAIIVALRDTKETGLSMLNLLHLMENTLEIADNIATSSVLINSEKVTNGINSYARLVLLEIDKCLASCSDNSNVC